MKVKHISGTNRHNTFAKIPVGAKFRFKSGTTWYVMLEEGLYCNANNLNGPTYYYGSHKGGRYHGPTVLRLVVQIRENR